MRRINSLFIDDGGVMNDNALRGPEWGRLVAEFFVPILGGNHSAWEEANRIVIDRPLPFLDTIPEGQDYEAWYEVYQMKWLKDMSSNVGVDFPGDDARCLKLALEGTTYVTERVRSAYPDAAETIQVLSEMGFKLFTASGEHSRELEGYLKGMEIRQHFDTLYGPDLVNQGKLSVEYYNRIFTHACVVPENTLVVDDKSHNLAWAKSLGAVTCLVSSLPTQDTYADFVVSKLGDLPIALDKLM